MFRRFVSMNESCPACGYVFGRESPQGVADALAWAVTVNDLDYAKGYLPKIMEVTPADVQRADGLPCPAVVHQVEDDPCAVGLRGLDEDSLLPDRYWGDAVKHVR